MSFFFSLWEIHSRRKECGRHRMRCGSVTHMKKFRIAMICFIILGLIGVFTFFYVYEWKLIPDTIYIEKNMEEILPIHAHVKGELYRVDTSKGEVVTASAAGMGVRRIDLMDEVSLTLNEGEHYKAKLKFLGVIPHKEIDIIGVDRQYLYPLGDTVGIYIKIDGILVIDTGFFTNDAGEDCAPCRNCLQEGDYITAVNGVAVSKKSEFTELVKESNGNVMELTLRRDGKILTVSVQPEKATDGQYKLGIWIRDSLQGLGTMTAMDDEGNFVALGHSINDMDTGEIVEIGYGNLYKASIVAVNTGKKGEPGELSGVIKYRQENILGDVETNTEQGISGVMKQKTILGEIKEPLPIGYKQDVCVGEAWIYSDLIKEGGKHKILISEVNINTSKNKKGITFEVVDKELLNYSGGIVQGMSGSPIIQDGKIIGAVTHVLINDPKQGYGIFIENMLNRDN